MNQDKPPQNNAKRPDGKQMRTDHLRDTECDSLLELIPAYSIGATDPDENEFIKRKLAECPEATMELSKYMRLVEALHYSASPAETSPGLVSALKTAINVPPTPPTISMPRQQSIPKPVEGRRVQALFGQNRRLGLVLSSGLIIILFVLNIYWVVQLEQVHSRQEQVADQLHQQDIALMLIGLGASNRIELPAVQSGVQPVPFAAIVGDPQGTYGLLYVKDFPVLESGKAYQLWLEQGGQKTSGGVFSVDEDGLGIMVFHTSMPIRTFESIEITTEPVVGSATPTTSPIVRRKF